MSAAVHMLKKPPVPEVVEYLERALARAKAGDTFGVMILQQDADGLGFAIAGIDDRFTVAGWLLHAIHKLQTDPPE